MSSSDLIDRLNKAVTKLRDVESRLGAKGDYGLVTDDLLAAEKQFKKAVSAIEAALGKTELATN